MALENIMQIAGRAMDAQTIRMNLQFQIFRMPKIWPILPTALTKRRGLFSRKSWIAKWTGGLASPGERPGWPGCRRILILRFTTPLIPMRIRVDMYGSNVDVMQEMVDITAASRAFESAVEASNTAKRLMTRTIEMLQK